MLPNSVSETICPPEGNETMKKVYGYRQQDLRSIAFHKVIADKLRRDPGLLSVAFENIERWTRLGYSRSTWPLYEKWQELLRGPFDVLVEKLTEDSDAMQQLRSATPFAGILTNAERWEVIEQTRACPETGAVNRALH